MTLTWMFRLAVTLLSAVAAASASTIIDFEAQGASAPPTFNSSLDSPLTIGVATFTGGKLLKNEAFGMPSADTTVVYATTGFIAGYTDPLVIKFSQPISNISLLVTNQTPDIYTLADNVGNSTSLLMGNNVSQTLSLVDSGVTQVTIGTAATVGWDFAIDNVTFTSSVSSVPEPAPYGFMSVGLWAVFWISRTRRVR